MGDPTHLNTHLRGAAAPPALNDDSTMRLRCPVDSCGWTTETFLCNDFKVRDYAGSMWRRHWRDVHTPYVIFERVT